MSPTFPRLALLLLAVSAQFLSAQSSPNPAIAVSVPRDPWQMPIQNLSLSDRATMQDLADALRPQLKAQGIQLDVHNTNAQIRSVNFSNTTLKEMLESLAWSSRGAFSFYASSSYGRSLELSYSVLEPENSLIEEFDFKGGTVKELADKIRAENFGWTNIYVRPESEGQPVPAFKVKRVSFQELCSIVRTITQGRCRITWNGTFLILGDNRPETPEASATAILPLQELLGHYKIEDINALVQTALKMRDTRNGRTEKKPDMSLHKETSTLVVVGTEDQVALVQSVIAALAKQDAPPAEKKDPATPAKTTP